MARTLLERGEMLMDSGRYREAGPILRRALAVAERTHGLDTREVAYATGRLAACHKELAEFSTAGPLYQRALFILEGIAGRQGSEVATMYRELAALEHAAGNRARGVPFARTAVRLRKRESGVPGPAMAADLITLAALLDGQLPREEAERLYKRARRILEHSDPAHPQLAVVLNNLAAIEHARRRTARAEALYRQALALDTAHFGAGHPRVAVCANNLAVLLTTIGRSEEALTMLRGALGTLRQSFGSRAPSVARCLENLAVTLRAIGRRREAASLARRANRILSRVEAVNGDGVAATATINPARAAFRLIVQPSRINRFGVFTEERIPSGRRIIEYTGQRIGLREARRRSALAFSYLFAMRGYWIDGAIGGSGAEYVNHSCAPNLRARRVNGRILYFSLREINAGEELTIDYGYSPDLPVVRCDCGAAGCRGTINRTRRREPRVGSRQRAWRA